MSINIHEPKQALHNPFCEGKTDSNEIERFKANHIQLIDHSNEHESQEFPKNFVDDFLEKTYFGLNHNINIKGQNDLVIRTCGKEKSKVVLIDQLGFGVYGLGKQEIGVVEGGCHDN